jgi:endogenous inhibitor of DNA gyrase (YacG/DUF329 family)
MTTPITPRTVRCPSCGAPARYAPDNPWRPFCSERCKQIDLGAWASERFRVADPTPPDADSTADEALRH